MNVTSGKGKTPKETDENERTQKKDAVSRGKSLSEKERTQWEDPKGEAEKGKSRKRKTGKRSKNAGVVWEEAGNTWKVGHPLGGGGRIEKK